MKRREFLRSSLQASAITGAGLCLGMPLHAFAACSPVVMPRTLVNLMFYGGMDSRFIFMPAPNHWNANYVNLLWTARKLIYPTAYPDYASMFAAEYDLVSDPFSQDQFGIFNRCAWLKNQFNAGRVAIIANSVCSENRRHEQSQLNANVGQPDFGNLFYDRDGWGGRLVEQMTGMPNTIELSHEISVFGNGTVSGQRLQRVIHAKNTRDIALPSVNPAWSVTDRRNVVTRALKSYYAARGAEVSANSNPPFSIFFQHNSALRAFGDQIKERLDACGALPIELSNLALNSDEFAQQCRNLYDVCVAEDVLNPGTVSMRYDGWDTHNGEYARISENLSDVFGLSGGLATAMQQIATIPTLGPLASDQLVFYVASDFGRQLIANGDRGTDHGRGIYSMLIGHDVTGGVYGEMFPEREARPDSNGKIPLQTSGADIQGLTSTQRILAKACDWVRAGSSTSVFPSASSSPLESPALLDGLLSI